LFGPIGEPLETQLGVETVQIGHPGQQAVGMFDDDDAHWPLPKLDHRGGEGFIPARTDAFSRKLSKRTVDYGEGEG
jgi:hypothetical protein